MMDIEWILTAALEVTKDGDRYLVKEMNADKPRGCIISYDSNGRMLFDGQYIYTEEFIGYVGLLDEVNDRVAESNPVMIEAGVE